jgi:toxin CptA
MSIAVSAVVRPSACLRLLLAGFAAAGVAAAVMLVWAGDVAFHQAAAGAAASLLAGAVCGRSLLKNRTAHRIDISPVGLIRLTVYQQEGSGGAATLMAGSTVWPGLLMLRLRGVRGRVQVLAIWPGDVADGAFRELAVACRALSPRRTG